MSAPQQTQYTVSDAFGKALGFIFAFYATIPFYKWSHVYLEHFALRHIPLEFWQFFELLYLIGLFFVLIIAVWAALRLVLTLIVGGFKYIHAMLTFRRYRP